MVPIRRSQKAFAIGARRLVSITGDDAQVRGSPAGSLISNVGAGTAIDLGDPAHNFTSCVSAGGSVDADCPASDTSGANVLLTDLGVAIADFGNLNTLLAGLGPGTNLGAMAIGGYGMFGDITAASAGDLEVFSLTSLSAADGGVLRINGASNDVFVILVTGGLSVGNDFGVSLTGGVLPDRVIFSFGGTFVTGDRATLNGTYVGQSTCMLGGDDDKITGALLCSGDVSSSQRAVINATPFNYATIEGAGLNAVPEPATYSLFGAGLLALGFARRFTARRAA